MIEHSESQSHLEDSEVGENLLADALVFKDKKGEKDKKAE